jgi:hypothetical protein
MVPGKAKRGLSLIFVNRELALGRESPRSFGGHRPPLQNIGGHSRSFAGFILPDSGWEPPFNRDWLQQRGLDPFVNRKAGLQHEKEYKREGADYRRIDLADRFAD